MSQCQWQLDINTGSPVWIIIDLTETRNNCAVELKKKKKVQGEAKMMPINVLTMCLIILLPNRLDVALKSYFDDHHHADIIIVATRQHHSDHYKRGKKILCIFEYAPKICTHSDIPFNSSGWSEKRLSRNWSFNKHLTDSLYPNNECFAWKIILFWLRIFYFVKSNWLVESMEFWLHDQKRRLKWRDHITWFVSHISKRFSVVVINRKNMLTCRPFHIQYSAWIINIIHIFSFNVHSRLLLSLLMLIRCPFFLFMHESAIIR